LNPVNGTNDSPASGEFVDFECSDPTR